MIRQQVKYGLLLILIGASLQFSVKARGRFLLMEWNVENLYDTCHNEGIDDYAFLPNGSYRWTGQRYLHKLRLIAQTIASAGGVSPVDLIALCEVENDSVLKQLTRYSVLGRLGYQYVMTRSPDLRGMNVALIYQPGRFKLVDVRSIHVPPNRGERYTRDILHVVGILPTMDTMDVYVCHLPSRSGGQFVTDSYRRRGAGLIKKSIDSVFRHRIKPMIVVTGDFNDEPHDNSLRKVMEVKKTSKASVIMDSEMYLLSDGLKTKSGVEGTYFYKERWNRLDHVLVNGRLLKSDSSFRLGSQGCSILDFSWLLKRDSKGRYVPRRTFLGTFYQGGISDHLPLLTRFEF